MDIEGHERGYSPFDRFFEAQGFVVLDGGLATALEAAGHELDSRLWSARLLLDRPEEILAVHRAYLEAGADCITTAGYQASFEGFEAEGLASDDAERALRSAVDLAARARDAFWSEPADRGGRLPPLVAASAGPYGAFLADGSEYDGRYGVGREVLARFHRSRLEVLADTAADLIAFETVPSVVEAEVLGGLAAEHPDRPVWITFSCRDGRSLWDGAPIEGAVEACGSASSLVAVGVNCTHPAHVRLLVERIAGATDLPVVVYPNSGERYDRGRRAWSGDPAQWLDDVGDWVGAGARVVGGCCRVGPDTIRRLRSRLEAIHAL